ncbi:MAG: hypothetical protein WBC44_14990 [Planctomycetaceae bacterium]
MIRRILLIAILAGTPVAETRAEFLFTDLDRSQSGSTWTSDVPRPAPAPKDSDADERPDSGFANLPSGLSSTITSLLLNGGVPSGALVSPAARISDDGFVSYLAHEDRLRYEQPFLAATFRPPRTEC